MRTFIFIRNEKNEYGKLERILVGMTQSDMWPSNMTNMEDSEFYGCQCVEVSERCHIKLGVMA